MLCHRKGMELDSVVSTAALGILSEHAWNADCLCTGLAWEAVGAQKARAGQVWQECLSVAVLKVQVPYLVTSC